MKSPGQAIIAERLQLSQSSVSRALRNKPGIRPEVCAKVREVARELGYRVPEINDQKLDSPDGHFVGVLVHSPHRRWRQGGYLAGMTACAPELNASIILHHIDTVDCHSILDTRLQPPAMRSGLMKSIILTFRWPDVVVNQLSKQFHCISLQHEYPKISMDTITLDSNHAMRMLTQHLHELGHTKIGFVGRTNELSWSRKRFMGYVDSLYQLGLEFDPQNVIPVEASTLERYSERDERWDSHADLVQKRIKQGVRAWMASSDWAGYSIARKLIERGVRVPEDVSITGFDAAEEPELDLPRLTSARVPLEDMGAAALQRVLHRQSHPTSQHVQIAFQCGLQLGQSTAAPN